MGDDRTAQRAADACSAARMHASLLLDGQAADVLTREALERHLVRCEACARTVARMQLAAEALRRAPSERPRRSPSVLLGTRRPTSRPSSRRPAYAAALSAAAVVVGGAWSTSLLPTGWPAEPGRSLPEASSVAPTVGLPIGQRLALDDFVDTGYGLLVR